MSNEMKSSLKEAIQKDRMRQGNAIGYPMTSIQEEALKRIYKGTPKSIYATLLQHVPGSKEGTRIGFHARTQREIVEAAKYGALKVLEVHCEF